MKPSDKSSFSELIKPRIEVEKMNAYRAPLEGRRNLLRLDFNENTIGPSPVVVKALREIPSNYISIYPEYDGLNEAIAKYLNKSTNEKSIDPKQIGIFNGVDAAIHAIFHAYGKQKDQLLTTTPTFGYYQPCALMQGMQVIEIPYQGIDFQFPYAQIYENLIQRKPKLLFICNPNNPTGTKLEAEKIVALAKASPKTLIVIDEVYEAFLGESVLPIVDFNLIPNLIIMRSLSKTSGLAGLRIGFVISNEQNINYLNRVTGPYDINSFAVTAAFATLSDQTYVDNYISEVLKAREWVKTQLLATQIRHHIAAGNYFLIWPQAADKVELSLKSKGILIRNMKGKPLIDGSLRVSIGTTSQMQQFWKVFQAIDKENK